MNTSSRKLMEILIVSIKLGLTSFGGPVAHIGYFHNEYVRKRHWLDEQSFADLVALSQFLPGPSSSQVGVGIGIFRAGYLGGLLAWIGFTLPSFFILTLFAILIKGLNLDTGWIHGLKIVAIVIVAQAVLSMGQKFAADIQRAAIAVVAASIILIWQTAFSQLAVILIAGIVGLWIFRNTVNQGRAVIIIPISRKIAVICLILFLGILIALPLLRLIINNDWLDMIDSFYRSGALVFGGGHVILPLLEKEVVPTGWVSKDDFLAGYGLAQAMPGPLFTFAAYLGAMIKGMIGAIVATTAIFLPAFLLLAGAMPFWNSFRQNARFQGGLIGINAAVVGILLAALYNPLWTSTIFAPADIALVLILFIMLVFWKLPPWVIVILGLAGGLII